MDDNEPPQPSRTAFASRFFNQVHHFKKLLLKYWWIPLLTVAAGEGVQLALLKHQKPAFVSEGKMIVNVKLSIPSANVYSEEFNNFFGTQVALMQIRSVVDRVNQQLQSTKPDLNRVPVKIEVTLSPKTSIFNLQALGTDPSYVQAYLQATMDEYIKLKRDLLSNATTATQSTMQEELKQMAAQLENSKMDLINYQSSNSVVLLQPAGGNSAAERLANLTKELAEDRSELQMEQTLTLDQNLERIQGASPPANFGAQSNAMSRLPAAISSTGADAVHTSTPSNLGGFEQAYLDAKQQLLASKVRLKELLGAAITNTAPEIVTLRQEITHQQNLLDFYQDQSAEQMKNRQHTLQLKIADLNQQISEWEPKAVEVSRKLSDYEALKETHQRLQNMYDQMQANLQTLDVNKGIGQESVTVLEPAATAQPVPLETSKHLVMAGLIGLILGIGILFFASQLDDRPSSFAELQQLFDHPVVGQIPLVKAKDRNPVQPVLQFDDDRYALIETYRSLRSAFLYKDSYKSEPTTLPKSIVITSAVPNEGKTVTSANFAITLAQAGAKVLLIDADLRRGALHEHFSANVTPGLAEVLSGQCGWETAVVQTSIPNLHFLPRGTISRQSHNSFATSKNFLTEIAGYYDYHILDTAPVMVADDVLSLAPNVDGVMMVIRAGFTSARVAHVALDMLQQRQVNVIGIVFNAVHPKASNYNYARFKEYYTPETA